ncbi:hypothetical protein J2805_003870 [Arthrobacter oryzae]|nr:hypothetical protein [Arthrobacter oryzae]
MELNRQRTGVIAVHCQGDIVSKEGDFAPFFFEEVERCHLEGLPHARSCPPRRKALWCTTRVAFSPDHNYLVPNPRPLMGGGMTPRTPNGVSLPATDDLGR